MTVREYLGQIWEINERINKELRKLEDIKSRLYSSGIDYSKPRVQTSPRDTMAHIYAEIDEQERYVTELIDKLADLKATVTEQINGIETPLCRYVLHQHYVNCINMTDLSALSRNTFTRCAVFSPPFIGEKNGVLFAFSRLFRASGAFAGFK